jgi:hypothetical protein
MSSFDQMCQAIRDDCDDVRLANGAELRRLGAHRTVVHRAVGGAATLAVAVGVTTGFLLLGSAPPATTPTVAASTVPASTSAIMPLPRPVITKAPPSHPATVIPKKTAPASPKTHTARSTPAKSPVHRGTPACVDSNFDGNHPTVVSDDAAGIIGYDIQIKYRGTATCRLSQPPRVFYTTVNGQLIAFGIDSAHSHPKSAPPITVHPGRTVFVTVYGVDGRNITPVPPTCASEHVYKGIAVGIDGQDLGLLDPILRFPCAGPVSMIWALLPA